MKSDLARFLKETIFLVVQNEYCYIIQVNDTLLSFHYCEKNKYDHSYRKQDLKKEMEGLCPLSQKWKALALAPSLVICLSVLY